MNVFVVACGKDENKKKDAVLGECRQTAMYSKPLVADSGSQFYIGYYVDHSADGDGLSRDYQGGFLTYDGHKGTDILISDFTLMDRGVDVVAARGGCVTATEASQYDRNTNWANSDANYVTIDHGDGSQASYLHLKTNSIPANIVVGAAVNAGDKLGQVGSSGRSYSPHLHFELIQDGLIVDLFACGMADFQYAYNNQPVIVDMGITDESDASSLSNDYFAVTPNKKSTIDAGGKLYAWFKTLAVPRGETLKTILVSPSGSESTLYDIAVTDNKAAASYFAYDAVTSPGTYTVKAYFASNPGAIKEASVIVR